MSRDVFIYYPRVDVPFKDFGVPVSPTAQLDNLPPIREHWYNFIENLFDYHINNRNDMVHSIMKPLYDIKPEDFYEYAGEKEFDIVYVPHRDKGMFPITKNAKEVRYYMQTVFPNYFTVDTDGWGAGMSFCPVDPATGNPDSGVFENLQLRTKLNYSKFEQPSRGIISSDLEEYIKDDDFILFVCQIPHDLVIKLHSDVSVEEALKRTIDWAKRLGKKLVIKGHPANLGAMASLLKVWKENGAYGKYCDLVSIHDLLERCSVAVMVNSGVGFEAMLHEKPVVAYGRAEYSRVINISETNSLAELTCNVRDYKAFMDAFISKCVNWEDMNTYIHL